MIARTSALAASWLLLAACGGGSGGPARGPSTNPEGPSLTARELGALSPGECSTKSYIAQMGAACAGLPARNARTAVGLAAAAADGDVCTVWNSGGVPPQTILVDLEKDASFTGLLLVPEMTPPEGDVVHVLEHSIDGNTWTPLGVLKMHMADDHVYAVTFPAKITSRLLRITTSASPSWVAWGEVEPVRCGG
jgi:F5/8 type C domain